jgi:DNA invertase Pin-like site-specific DNA recombinase
MSDKILASHLERGAYVYVRQSSMQQVKHHKESQRRQYALQDRARQLGFVNVYVIDDDLGRSGSGRHERPGFGRLLAAVCEGLVGAVFALEASRLARNNRDWHHLVDLCALTDTLLIDDDGVYDPGLLNDRLLLGLKGTMSEFELSLLRQRAQEARMDKIKRGHVLWEMPVGFVRTRDDLIEITPDRQVQHAIRSVFSKIQELGSARQVMLWYREERVPLPEVRSATRGQEVVWKLPTQSRIRQILRNPCYAGALAWGKMGTTTEVIEGKAVRAYRRKARKDWTILQLEHHPGYISWEEYLRNQDMLESNLTKWSGESGAAKKGTALLAGLLRCGRCGRKLHVLYSGNSGRVPRYACNGGRKHRGSASCLSVGGLPIDRAVSSAVLEVIEPAGIAASVAAADAAAKKNDEKRRALELALEKARYEAERAERQYDAIEPENRLVAAELESRWNVALEAVEELKQRINEAQQQPVLVPSDREHLLALGRDLPAVWEHPEATTSLKKRILRTVLEEIVISVGEDESNYILRMHWVGGAHTEVSVRRNKPGRHRNCTDQNVLELIRELSKVCSNKQIAAVLNRLGYKTGCGNPWREHRVATLKHNHRIPSYRRRDDWLTLEETAKTLQLSDRAVKRMIDDGTLPATQVVQYAPWVIERNDLDRKEVRQAVASIRQGRRRRPSADPQQANFSF